MSFDPTNPQAAQMAHESMLRCLAAQAAAIWPLEREVLARLAPLPHAARVLDVACGSGEFSRRIAAEWPTAQVVGIDVEESLLARAGELQATLDPAVAARIRYGKGNAYALDQPDNSYDVVACRHFLQAIPEPENAVAEMRRVLKPGGHLHVIGEDYTLIHFHPTRRDCSVFWHQGPVVYAERTGTDLRIGTKLVPLLAAAGLTDIRADYLPVDTLRTPRELFIQLWEAWRDGYTDVIAANTGLTRDDILDYWNDMLDCLRNPHGYAVWLVPMVGATKP